MKNFKWEGVMPAITTQFDSEGSLSLKAFKNNLAHQIKAGVHGIILGGTLGEASTLTSSEKESLLKATLEQVEGKIPVIMNIAEQSTDQAIVSAKDAETNGASGLMLLPPMRYRATDIETVAYFSAVASSTSLPIMIYNNPVDYKIEVTLDMFEAIKKYENITAVKESTRDITNITRMINRFGDRYKILCGVDTIAMESILMGAKGWVAGLVDSFPEETVAIFTYCKAGEWEKARAVFRWFLPLLELDISPQLVQNIKLCEQATGLGTGYLRKPRLPLEGLELKRVELIIKESLAKRPKNLDYKNYL
ncbi:dihydrodipicolinate synthase family protein [Flavobacteriaceae bacterium]|jgi:4-hydroxy-tetrahydrodipicolinate synthase|nr:dihydrodipicolinate synthase family protein [Flavobacteriaceae bacterium]MDB4063615.1 dihydrodipicolinate synthase family protein [Flavobacteriaceae bacterium]MDB4235231.1 dihydrodipicolinate synthase family protein [bacterium]MDB4255911.1 dihydrodipicolinate synthase family protein [Flavobacteriaceae bacterium]MDC1392171.1 dihydrodipicolinate synthase family protein [Flavobacteriaceae bacterium]